MNSKTYLCFAINENCLTMKKCYLITTGHLEDRLWFLDEDDFVAGMNYVAVQAAESKVTILAFILMSNHLHFVVYGRWEDVWAFINALKGRYSKYLRHKYGHKEFLRGNDVDILEVSEENEALERAIAYVQMNSVAANICSHATQYPWGTGNVYFNVEKRKGTRLGDLSKRARYRLLHSESTVLPPDWLVCEGGYILPESYVNVAYVETLFRTPKRMNYFLTNSSKAKRRIDSSEESHPIFRDQVLLNVLPDLYKSMFQKERFEDLSPEQKLESLRQIRFRFCANIHQIARVTGLTYADAAKLLDAA